MPTWVSGVMDLPRLRDDPLDTVKTFYILLSCFGRPEFLNLQTCRLETENVSCTTQVSENLLRTLTDVGLVSQTPYNNKIFPISVKDFTIRPAALFFFFVSPTFKIWIPYFLKKKKKKAPKNIAKNSACYF